MKRLHAGAEENRGLVVRDELAQTYGDVCRCDSQAATPESPAVFHCEDGAHSTRPRITTWEAGWNVTNAIQVSTHTHTHTPVFSFQLAAGTVHTTQHTGIH